MNYKGMVLEVAGASEANSANVRTAGWSNTNSKKFTITTNADGTVTIVNKNSGKVLDIKSGTMANKQNVQQYTSNGSAAQKWVLLDVTSKMTKKTYEGTYTIRSAVNNNFTLDIASGSKNNKANLQLYKNNNSNAQTFILKYVGDGLYSITNKNSGKVLDVNGGKAANKQNVQQYTWNGSKAQMWKIVKNSDGTITIQSALNNSYVLDLAGGKAVNKANIQLYKGNGSKAQKWKLVKR